MRLLVVYRHREQTFQKQEIYHQETRKNYYYNEMELKVMRLEIGANKMKKLNRFVSMQQYQNDVLRLISTIMIWKTK